MISIPIWLLVVLPFASAAAGAVIAGLIVKTYRNNGHPH